jgi:hypothetical protein
MLHWLRRLGHVDNWYGFKQIDGVDIPYYFYRLVESGQAHSFYLTAK